MQLGENHLTTDEPTGSIDGIDADALLSQIEGGGNREIPMHGTESAEPAQQSTQTRESAPAPQVDEFEFNWNGKQIKADREKILRWASQGYDYPQKMEELKRQREDFEKQFSPYKTIDEYAKQNPDWWSYVESQYQARTQGAGTDSASTSPELSSLKAQILQELSPKLTELEKFKQDHEQKQAADKAQAEDQALEQEISSIRTQYANLDWKTPDESGLTLDQRVIKHAVETGIQSFRAAFRDYNHEHLVKLAAEQAKETLNKDLQKRTKQGLLGTSSTPKKGVSPAEGVKSKSYDALLAEAKEELGIA